MSKSVNKVFLVGNLTREPELIQSEGKHEPVPKLLKTV
jgi:single-stranded DNA-binding protein